MKPIIGITPGTKLVERPHGNFHYVNLNEEYAAGVAAAGGVPVILPFHDDPAAVLPALDGVLLSGGPDVDPAIYGDDWVHPKTYGIDDRRDSFEIGLAQAAEAAGVPILGICRGIQVLNVAFGGTLIQDVAEGRESLAGIGHSQDKADLPADRIGHLVEVLDHPMASKLGGKGTLGVNTFHHQAIKQAADRLDVLAWSQDGLVEAVAGKGETFVLGVQWHPEMMFRAHDRQLLPFISLVEAARERKLAGAF